MSKPHIIHEDAFFASLPLSDYPALPSNVGNRGRTPIFPRMALTSSDSSMILGETDFPSTLPLEPPLPLEILMQILEYTASLSRPSAASVSLVSAWARKLALPHLFRALVHRKVPLANVTVLSATRSASLPASRTPLPTHLGQYVRALWTESIGMASPTSEMDIFRACPAVEHLALPAPALRTLYMVCQTFDKHDRVHGRRGPGSGNTLPFLSALREVTLLSHTLRYEWHFLVGLRIPDGRTLLGNITHLRMLDMQISAYVPHAHLSNLTHLALPYLDLGANISHDLLRLPEGVLEHPKLKMVVLTVDERKYLHNPWYHIVRYSAAGTGNVRYSSPRESFRELVKQAHLKDKRVHVILSPRIGQSAVDEWDAAARGGESIWEIAERVRGDEQYGMELPSTYAPGIRR
ncbi:uncharacterized protein C8Q71DRAFT_173404 [Rhodofomes roseus]|uniref:F-box domain-containing protein n=1 Tax=Rhodofomes roseus TaxID=34475 RepID=A0ABQ8K9G6_9APHY|nr:uncharacterized protein C8Q71DRAFT_173404 [Rhodofomes roseus]KAH9833757.1 hypothetical protein C8Q71DRAFT_173404 [Rhodofomes roseus]